MTGRLFRFTPLGGKPNHYTDSFRSALAQLPHVSQHKELGALGVGEHIEVFSHERTPGVMLLTTVGTWERVA